MSKECIAIDCEIKLYANTISKMYSVAEEQGMYDYGELSIVGSAASTLEALNKYRSIFHENGRIKDEDKESDYIRFLESEIKNLLLDIYHIHKDEFDEFANDASQVVTDDIISSMMKSV